MHAGYLWYMATAIGEMIEKEMRRQGFGATAFSRMISYSRTNVYNIFKRQSVDTSLLEKVCKALNVTPSFFYERGYRPPEDLLTTEEGQEGYQASASRFQKQIEQQQQEIEYLRKLVTLMEEKDREKEEAIRKLEEKVKRLVRSRK